MIGPGQESANTWPRRHDGFLSSSHQRFTWTSQYRLLLLLLLLLSAEHSLRSSCARRRAVVARRRLVGTRLLRNSALLHLFARREQRQARGKRAERMPGVDQEEEFQQQRAETVVCWFAVRRSRRVFPQKEIHPSVRSRAAAAPAAISR